MKIKLLIALVASALTASAASITFSAAVSNSLRGANGALLADTDVVEVGLFDGSTIGSFVAYAPAADVTSNFGYENGFFSQTIATFNSNADAGDALAIRWSSGGYTGLIGLTGNAEWVLKAGDGSGTDFAQNLIDVSDLTGGTQTGALVSGAVVLGDATYGAPLNLAAANTFSLVPEPSSAALLAGLLALGSVMLRRRAA
jgi:hypothetical protein